MEWYASKMRVFFGFLRKIFKRKSKQDEDNKDLKILTDSSKTTTNSQAENNNEELKELKSTKQKCNKCDLCEDCQKDKDKDDKKKKDKEELEANLRVLNLTAFFIIFTSTIIVNLSIWITISN